MRQAPLLSSNLKYYRRCGARCGRGEHGEMWGQLWCYSRETVGLVNVTEWTKSISLALVVLIIFPSFFFYFIFWFTCENFILIVLFFYFFFPLVCFILLVYKKKKERESSERILGTDPTSNKIPGRVTVSRT